MINAPIVGYTLCGRRFSLDWYTNTPTQRCNENPTVCVYGSLPEFFKCDQPSAYEPSIVAEDTRFDTDITQ